MSKNHYNVVIVGGGLSGMTLACLVAGAGVPVACIDQADPAEQIGGDIRTTAISYGSHKILAKAGIWKDIEPKVCPIEDIRILDGNSPVLLDFHSEEVENRAFGWIVDNRDLRKALLSRMKSLKSAKHMAPEQIVNFEPQEDLVKCTLASGDAITADLVIGADGRFSSLREWMDIPERRWSYNQRAVICMVEHENDHKNQAIEHFWPGGPFAVLPMCDDEKGKHRSSVVFTEHGPEAASLMKMDEKTFELALSARFPADYGAVKMLGKRACFPLGLVHPSQYIAPRMALVADAAHGIHPIAGQGLNLGFRDVAEIADLVIDAHEKGQDVGSSALLETYQRRRRPDNTAMVAVTDGLVRLFSNDVPPVRALRRAGLRIVSKLPPAKRFFMKQAMGDR